MTTEEKLQHFYEVSMESAREESEKALEEYRAALSQMLAEHKEDKQKNAGGQLKLETENAKRGTASHQKTSVQKAAGTARGIVCGSQK